MPSTSVPSPAFDSEMMTVTDPAELSQLMAVADSEGVALVALDGCVGRLHQVQATRAALARLAASSLRAALQARGDALGEGGRE
jgi:hypothetical protein